MKVNVRRAALEVLKRCGEKGGAQAEAVSLRLDDINSNVQLAAVEAL